jgi:uncharacterized repeat protein (TIGR03803 family)
VFKITPSGTLSIVHTFNMTDGSQPTAGLIQATDRSFYGTTSEGGCQNQGTVFKITSNGVVTTLYNFCSQTNCADGAIPNAPLLQGTDGNFYGTTHGGGTRGAGTVFKLSVGLRPFVATLPTAAAVGSLVRILGTKLSGATGVSFNGTASSFTVISDTEIDATVPNGATNGDVMVSTPNRKLKSNKKFRVVV